MPSLHIGWPVLIAVVLVRVAPQPIALLGVFVVVITANHWLLDGVVATALLGVGLPLFPEPSRYRNVCRGGWPVVPRRNHRSTPIP